MENKKVIIIGAGIAGLSAGCYLQMNNYDTEIFELHDKPGGLCTSWKRNGYTFDGCIHSISGKNLKYRLSRYINELVNMEKVQFHFWEELVRYEDENGNVVKFYTDPDKLEKELIRIAPEDIKFITKFIKDIKKMSKFDTLISKPIELWNPLDYFLSQFKTAPYIRYLIRYKISIEDLIKKCKTPLLKRVLDQDFFSYFPSYFFLLSLGHLHNKNAGYPIGGSLPFACLIEKKYLELSGKINYNLKVTKINTENNKAIGITLENNEVHNTDIIISAADGHYTIFEMLGGKYVNKKITKLYSDHSIWPSYVLVFLGVSRTFENEPSQIGLHLKEAIIVDDQSKLNEIPINVYSYDPTLAPKGKTCIKVILKTDNYQYWNDLRENNRVNYDKEKDRISNKIIEILDQRFKNLRSYIEVIDVATPATFIRYTNNWKGSIEGWEWLPGLIPETVKKELPGLKNFYMIGQWVMPGGGIPSGIISGRDITRILCKKNKKKFQVI